MEIIIIVSPRPSCRGFILSYMFKKTFPCHPSSNRSVFCFRLGTQQSNNSGERPDEIGRMIFQGNNRWMVDCSLGGRKKRGEGIREISRDQGHNCKTITINM